MAPKRQIKTRNAPNASPSKGKAAKKATKHVTKKDAPTVSKKKPQGKVPREKGDIWHSFDGKTLTPKSAESIVAAITSPDYSPECGFTPLMLAVHAHRLDVVRLLLLDHAPNVHAVNNFNYTALHHAVLGQNLEMVKCLVEEGRCDVSTRASSESTPFHSDPNSDIMLYLLDKGGIPEGALHTVSRMSKENIEVVQYLVSKGCDVDEIVEPDPDTPLLCALRGSAYNNDSRKVALYLLQHGANPNAVGLYNHTPLHLACRSGFADVVKVLVSNSVSIDVVDADGNSPLQLVGTGEGTEAENAEIVQLLTANVSSSIKRDAFQARS